MPPIPDIRAAHALPAACLEVGKTSTTSARSTAETNCRSVSERCHIYKPWIMQDGPALIEKSIQYIDRTASQIVSASFLNRWEDIVRFGIKREMYCSYTADVLSVVNMVATGRVYPRRSMAKRHRMDPPIMYGRRLPKEDVELSAKTPT